MPEGYFPEGEPTGARAFDLDQRLQEIREVQVSLSEDDYAGQIHVINRLLDILPVASLEIARGRLIELRGSDGVGGHHEAAIHAYRRALWLEPGNLEATIDLGMALLRWADNGGEKEAREQGQSLLQTAEAELIDTLHDVRLALYVHTALPRVLPKEEHAIQGDIVNLQAKASFEDALRIQAEYEAALGEERFIEHGDIDAQGPPDW